MDTQTENIENIPVRGITWKQLICALLSIIGGLMTIEATMLGIYYKQESRITNCAEKIESTRGAVVNMRVDVDVLKIHAAGTDAEIKGLQNRPQ